MIIELTIKTDANELIAKETAFNFESAGESLGKLERFVEKIKDETAIEVND